ncbi:uncharacterized protein Z518_09951 [Rhinocladiella mackenziei CBS 650.93]|uniref:Major facilitator superfamily (MFS) profile domain-containing protein n=1 Tax=Rhinocladiella mackenziei CBS 650.93 TaxID=1442369 RepID=A0A0D2ICA5_9EURO|nr:uncharacterized protein Z518_09951 [Rhinocladiella mackenziei CBS 650.93]KIX00886.1 hypothetical protein Z518_09951 [Rhinocladiella mackenziei CBS 650.93]
MGRRNVTILGNTLGVIGCIVASQATSINTVIADMALIGFGGRPQLLAYAGANEIVPRKSRGTTMACVSLASIPRAAFGAVIAYTLAEHLGWRWAFYVGHMSNAELDYVGVILYAGGLTSFLVGVTFGNSPYPWTSVHVLAPLLVGGITVFIAFPLWEIYCPYQVTKLCPPKLFKNFRGFTLPQCATFVASKIYSSANLRIVVQILYTAVAEEVGWYSLAHNGAGTAGAIFSGVEFARFRRTKWQLLIATNTPVMACVFVALGAVAASATQIYGILIIQFGAKDHQIGIATGLSGTFRAAGGSIGTAVYSTILNQQSKPKLVPAISTAVLQAGLPPASLTAFLPLLAVPGATPAIIAAGRDAVRTVYSNAFSMVFLVSIAFGVTAAISAAFVRSVDDKLTTHVAVRLDNPHLIPGQGRDEAMVLSTKEVEVAGEGQVLHLLLNDVDPVIRSVRVACWTF